MTEVFIIDMRESAARVQTEPGQERGRDEEKGMGEAYQVTSFTENEQFYISHLEFCPNTSLSLPKHHQKTRTTHLVTSRTLISDVRDIFQFGNLPRYRNQRGGGRLPF